MPWHYGDQGRTGEQAAGGRKSRPATVFLEKRVAAPSARRPWRCPIRLFRAGRAGHPERSGTAAESVADPLLVRVQMVRIVERAHDLDLDARPSTEFSENGSGRVDALMRVTNSKNPAARAGLRLLSGQAQCGDHPPELDPAAGHLGPSDRSCPCCISFGPARLYYAGSSPGSAGTGIFEALSGNLCEIMINFRDAREAARLHRCTRSRGKTAERFPHHVAGIRDGSEDAVHEHQWLLIQMRRGQGSGIVDPGRPRRICR